MNQHRMWRATKTTWEELTLRYGTKCVYCHKIIATVIDHVIPYSYCRYNGLENLRPSCVWCNLIVSDKVFEGFEEKYNFIKDKRNSKRFKGNNSLLCPICLFPYYSALHANLFLCPICYDKEYGTKLQNKKAFQQWAKTLTIAGIDIHAHRLLSDFLDLHKLKWNEIIKVNFLIENSLMYESSTDLMLNEK